ncbi:helix-turn-helix domain-containing protein [Parasphingorhabdus sp.]
MSPAVHQTGVSPDGLLTFGLVCAESVQEWQGQDSSFTELLSFGSSDPFDGVSVRNFQGTTISIEESEVERLADRLGLNIPDWVRTSARLGNVGQDSRLAAIRKLSNAIIEDSTLPITEHVEEEIAAGLLLVAASDEKHDDKSSPETRSRALSKAIELMQTHLEDNVSIGSICKEIGVSWRTLDRAFCEKFGVGPKKYYLRFRLSRVRSELFQKAHSQSVSDIANNWGFWHLGQFAQDYHKMFGELPSATNPRKA